MPWEEAEGRHFFEVRLLDDDGKPVVPEGSPEGAPLAHKGRLQINPDSPLLLEDSARKLDVYSSFVVSVSALKIPPGRRYRWVMEIDGKEVGSRSFVVRPEVIPEENDESEQA
ncbi:hypothetical protein AB0J31_32480 [Streptosporangium saharense]